MKIILIILSVVGLLGLISSSFLAKSFQLGLKDSSSGLIILVVLWAIYFTYKYFKNK